MSQDMVTLRRQIKQASAFLRQGNMVSAVQAVIGTLRLMLSTPLMKAEREDFCALVAEAVDYIGNDAGIRKLYPLTLTYKPGEEKILLEAMMQLMDVLKEESVSEAERITAAQEAKKQAILAKGQEKLDSEDYNAARAMFKALTNEFPTDGTLRGEIGERFLSSALYEDAAAYFSEAVDLDPRALRNYNRLAIALRRIGRFNVAEEYYTKALSLAPEDPNLLFNVGRLYLDWQKWDQAAIYGEKAHALNPDFVEAEKLALFAKKKAGMA